MRVLFAVKKVKEASRTMAERLSVELIIEGRARGLKY